MILNYIFLDDERTYEINPLVSLRRFLKEEPGSTVVYVCRNADECINVIQNLSDFYIDFDHDLGNGKSGYDVAKYIVENQLPCKGYRIHSMNPVGKQNIDQLLHRYKYWKFMD